MSRWLGKNILRPVQNVNLWFLRLSSRGSSKRLYKERSDDMEHVKERIDSFLQHPQKKILVLKGKWGGQDPLLEKIY